MQSHQLKPLAERMRPKTLEEFIGQEKLISENGIISKFLSKNQCPSMILWGPPGVGKTTLAYLIAEKLNIEFHLLSAISSGVKDLREIFKMSEEKGKMLLFIDEIHRFNKSQQDALLKAVETGDIVLIGATTENPSFEVNRALLSRCTVYILEELSIEDLKEIAKNAITNDEILSHSEIEIIEWESLLKFSSGDARKLLGIIEMVFNNSETNSKITIDNSKVESVIQSNISEYDKNGEFHYDVISAFIKSMRGSDPNGAVYWMTRMIESGEDLKFIARRMIIFASEDIGLANPNALLLANNCFDAVTKIGYPESSIILSQCVVYLATSPKSNSTYMALKRAQKVIKQNPTLSVPLHLRNAPTKLMKKLDYGKNYKYAHDYENNFTAQDYLPEKIKNEIFYQPSNNPKENSIKEWLKKLWPRKYK